MAEYYSGKRLLRYKVPYRIIIGERSNGKTYFVKKYCFDYYIKTGKKFVYIRKRKDSISRKEMKRLWADANEDYVIDELHDTIKYTPDSGFYYENENGRITIGYAITIEDFEAKKGVPYNDCDIIFFDEFIETRGDLPDEWRAFVNVLSTIRRKRDDIEIFLVSNTVTQNSIYFKRLGIDIKKLKQGQISYVKHKNGVECAIEYCRSMNIVQGVKKQDKYFGFDDSPESDMILYGEWEYNICNIKDVDGIGWSCKRRLVPAYVTAMEDVYEMSEYVSNNPIIFVRKVNTQNGRVKPAIKYNLSYDDSVDLVCRDGAVDKRIPKYGKVNELLPSEITEFWKVMKLCIEAKRVVFDTMRTGSDFINFIKAL